MKQLQALIFDVDGTLADTERDGHRVAFNKAFTEAGLDPASLFFDSFEYSSDALDGMLHSAASGEDKKD